MASGTRLDRLTPGSPAPGSGPGGGPPLEAVVFDLDGTLADTERDGHRVAFNRAFEREGLPDRWDVDLYGELVSIAGGKDRLLHYYTHHRPVPEAERERLAPMLHEIKNRLFLEEIVAEGLISPRPGAVELVRDLEAHGIRVAVATGGTRSWVEPLLERLLGVRTARGLAALVTGDQVTHGKPDPEIYLDALDILGCDPSHTVAVEDAWNGLQSARAAGMACVVVTNDYTAGQDLSDADLVADGFGLDGEPPTLLHDPHGIGAAGVAGGIRARTLRLVLAACERAAGAPSVQAPREGR